MEEKKEAILYWMKYRKSLIWYIFFFLFKINKYT